MFTSDRTAYTVESGDICDLSIERAIEQRLIVLKFTPPCVPCRCGCSPAWDADPMRYAVGVRRAPRASGSALQDKSYSTSFHLYSSWPSKPARICSIMMSTVSAT